MRFIRWQYLLRFEYFALGLLVGGLFDRYLDAKPLAMNIALVGLIAFQIWFHTFHVIPHKARKYGVTLAEV